MAMRRGRIRAIANIPIRRKNENNSQNESTIENELEVQSKLSVKSDEKINITADKKEKVAQIENIDKKDSSETDIKSINDTPIIKHDRKRIKVVAKVPIRNRIIKNDSTNTNNTVIKAENVPIDSTNTKVNELCEESNKFIEHNSQSLEIKIINQITDKQNSHENYEEHFTELPETISVLTVNESSEKVKPKNESELESFSTVKLTKPSISPSKNISRQRIRPILRMHSESEDENRYRTRNDSICSVSEGPTSPVKLSSMTVKKRSKLTDLGKKMIEARREFNTKFGNKTPDKHKLTMMDLIFYNPVSNPMPVTKTESMENMLTKSEISNDTEDPDDPDLLDSVDNSEETPDLMPVPQVKVGPDGQIILDERSLVIETSDAKKSRALGNEMPVLESSKGFGTYKRSARTKDWTDLDTLKFYRVLQMTGTDFSMMLKFFDGRSRRDLKLKFKKEERINCGLVDKVLRYPRPFDLDALQALLEEDKKAADKSEKEEKKRQQEEEQKKKTKKEKPIIKKEKSSWCSRQTPGNEVIEMVGRKRKYTRPNGDDHPRYRTSYSKPCSENSNLNINNELIAENSDSFDDSDLESTNVNDKLNNTAEKSNNNILSQNDTDKNVSVENSDINDLDLTTDMDIIGDVSEIEITKNAIDLDIENMDMIIADIGAEEIVENTEQVDTTSKININNNTANISPTSEVVEIPQRGRSKSNKDINILADILTKSEQKPETGSLVIELAENGCKLIYGHDGKPIELTEQQMELLENYLVLSGQEETQIE